MPDNDTAPATAPQGVAKIASALAKAQAEMGKALKAANNPHFRSKYADLGNVMDACLPALNANGIALIQPTGEGEQGRYVETMLIHGESGEVLSCRVPLIVAKNDMQGFGSAVTYARRYGLMAMAGIAPEDDDGTAAAKSPPKQDNSPPKRDETSDKPPREAIENATSTLKNADTLDRLKAIWGDLPATVRNEPIVIGAKDARKSELIADAEHDKAVKGDDDLQDEIPY